MRRPAALLADPHAPGAVELDLRRRAGPVAEPCPSAAPAARCCAARSRAPAARRTGSSPPGACASTRNRSLIGAETNHFCPVSRKVALALDRAARLGPRDRRARPQVRPALPLGDRQPGEAPQLLARRPAAPTRTPGTPAGAARSPRASRRHAAPARRRTVEDRTPRWPVSVCAQTTSPAARATCAAGGAPSSQGAAVRPARTRALQQAVVPAGVVLDLVDPPPRRVVRAQLRRVAVGELRPAGGAVRRRRAGRGRPGRPQVRLAPCRRTASTSARWVPNRSRSDGRRTRGSAPRRSSAIPPP